MKITQLKTRIMTHEELVKKAKKHYCHFLKFTIPKNKNFEHDICYNGKLLELLDVTHARWRKLKTK